MNELQEKTTEVTNGNTVRQHYEQEGLRARIVAALDASGIGAGRLSSADLAPLDPFARPPRDGRVGGGGADRPTRQGPRRRIGSARLNISSRFRHSAPGPLCGLFIHEARQIRHHLPKENLPRRPSFRGRLATVGRTLPRPRAFVSGFSSDRPERICPNRSPSLQHECSHRPK